MIRHIKTARDTAVKARAQAIVALKALLVGVPAALREQLEPITGKRALIERCAALRPGDVSSPTASARPAGGSRARRWLALDDEVGAQDEHLPRLTAERAPELVGSFGIGADTA